MKLNLKKIGGFLVDWIFPTNYPADFDSSFLLKSLNDCLFLQDLDLLSTPHIRTLFHYREPLVQKNVWQLKYRGNRTVAGVFARFLREEIIEIATEEVLWQAATTIIIIPLPSSTERLKEKGWNQNFIMADALKDYFKDDDTIFIDHTILLKTRHTKPQTSLNRKDRLLNLTDSFSVPDISHVTPQSFKTKGQTFIMYDDITTTGSTFKEASRALYNAGAKRILCLALAH